MVAIEIPDELASRIEHSASRAGQSNTAFLQEAVLSYIEDLEDIEIATERLRDPGETISLEQLKKNLGLNDGSDDVLDA